MSKLLSSPIVEVSHLTLSFRSEQTYVSVIKDINFKVYPNEILGIVGESGSGKSVTSLAIMGLLSPNNSRIENGSIHVLGKDTRDIRSGEWQDLRGNEVSMIFQEPMSSLNPSLRCGAQVLEILLHHTEASEREAKQEVLRLFEKVKLPDPERMYYSYPHQLSGGQKQRVMIAMAIACKPKLLIADEPTTALDVTVQQEIIYLLQSLQKETGMSMIFISHDLSLVSSIADRVLVMYKGEIVEQGDTQSIFKNPQEIYTKALLQSRPSLSKRRYRLPTIQDFLHQKELSPIISVQQRQKHHEELYTEPPLLSVRDVSKVYFRSTGIFTQDGIKAVNQVTFDIYRGETVGLVGESGCGKSTLSKVILQLESASEGTILYKGNDITKLKGRALREMRKDIQLIFQDPFASLNPRMMVGPAIQEPMEAHKLFSSQKERKQKVEELLEQVGLDATHYYRYPHEFSGGQRQRIGIARTIALQPKLIICDESVSALDISVQAQVLNLLNELKETFDFTYLFISHDLAVVKYMSDQLLVMNQGEIVEKGEADRIYEYPNKSYTKKLIDAIPGRN